MYVFYIPKYCKSTRFRDPLRITKPNYPDSNKFAYNKLRGKLTTSSELASKVNFLAELDLSNLCGFQGTSAFQSTSSAS